MLAHLVLICMTRNISCRTMKSVRNLARLAGAESGLTNMIFMLMVKASGSVTMIRSPYGRKLNWQSQTI